MPYRLVQFPQHSLQQKGKTVIGQVFMCDSMVQTIFPPMSRSNTKVVQPFSHLPPMELNLKHMLYNNDTSSTHQQTFACFHPQCKRIY